MPQNMFIFESGPFGRNLLVDASGRLIATGDSGGGLFPFTTGDTGRALVVDPSGRIVLSPLSSGIGGGGGGEANTASNVGASGTGVFKQKSGVDLEFKKLVAGHELAIISSPDSLQIDNSKIVAVASASGVTIDLKTGNKFRIPMSHNITFTFNGPRSGSKYTFILKQAVGSKTATWPANVKWRGGVAPSLTAASGARDVITMMYDDIEGVYLADAGLNFN